jgi:hypothetical protein
LYRGNVHRAVNKSKVEPRTTPMAQTLRLASAKGFSSPSRGPEFFCSLVPVVDASGGVAGLGVVSIGTLVVVDVKRGSTHFVALLSQLKHTVSGAILVTTNVVAVSMATPAASVANTAGTVTVAPASRPIPMFADGIMCMRLGKMCDWVSFPMEEFEASQFELMFLRGDMCVERVGRFMKTPAWMFPVPLRMSTPRRTSALRPRDRVRSRLSELAVNGRAVVEVLELR